MWNLIKILLLALITAGLAAAALEDEMSKLGVKEPNSASETDRNAESSEKMPKIKEQRQQDESSSASATNRESELLSSWMSTSRRLQKELRRIEKSKQEEQFTVELRNSNIFEWNVKLKVTALDQDSELASNMRKLESRYDQDHLLFHFDFPENFPTEPPFVRLVSPVISDGHVEKNGAICMELLTKSGWHPDYTVEAIIRELAFQLVDGDGRIRFGVSPAEADYTLAKARRSFQKNVESFFATTDSDNSQHSTEHSDDSAMDDSSDGEDDDSDDSTYPTDDFYSSDPPPRKRQKTQ